MIVIPYDRKKAINYASKFALRRNPLYTDFSNLGGDCTNFVSQCVYAGAGIMNYTPLFGWYYISSFDRSPSWTGVEFFYDFIVNNTGVGPFAEEVNERDIRPGDVIQFASVTGDRFDHTLFVSMVVPGQIPKIYISAHTTDVYLRPLSTYRFRDIRYIHIKGVNVNE